MHLCIQLKSFTDERTHIQNADPVDFLISVLDNITVSAMDAGAAAV